MWVLTLGTIAFAVSLSMLTDLLPKWLAVTLAMIFAYGLICWT